MAERTQKQQRNKQAKARQDSGSKPLSRRPAEIYDFIRETIAEQNYSPSIREICEAVGLSAPANVHRHLKTLEERGYITRASNSTRTIQLATTSARGLLLAGTITAGQPLETFQQEERLDLGSLYDSDDYFGLRVNGDSMIEAHIQTGDVVVIKKQNTCRDGQIVAALIDGSETTLKYFHKDKTRIRLQPANSSMEPIYPQACEIQG
ncbi:MAG: transcriptional repressor LexA, partial [Planctomycetaceae bacterium]